MHHSNHSGTITVGDPETRHFGDKGWIARYLRKMATIGQLEPDNERMSAYLKRVQMFFVAIRRQDGEASSRAVGDRCKDLRHSQRLPAPRETVGKDLL